MPDPGKLIWLDLETTGLQPKATQSSQILEIAMIITTGPNFEPVEQMNVVVQFKGDCDSPEAQAMHTASGLLEECAKSEIGIGDALVMAGGWVLRHGGESPLMAGSSIHFDVRWLDAYCPDFLTLFHYRRLDVSAVNELLRTQGKAAPPNPVKAHRAFADLRQSIALARYCVGGLLNG